MTGIFDVSITANRPDCQSIFGLAREVAAALGQPLKTPALDYTETEVEKEGFDVTVEAQDLVPTLHCPLCIRCKAGSVPGMDEKTPGFGGQQLHFQHC